MGAHPTNPNAEMYNLGSRDLGERESAVDAKQRSEESPFTEAFVWVLRQTRSGSVGGRIQIGSVG